MRKSKISTLLIQIEAIRCVGDYLLHLTSKNRTETTKFIFRYFLFGNHLWKYKIQFNKRRKNNFILFVTAKRNSLRKYVGTTSSTTPTNLSTENFSNQSKFF